MNQGVDMKIMITAATIMASFVCCNVLASPDTAAAEAGRFILVNRTYNVVAPDGTSKQESLFLLDTVTGKVYECSQSLVDGASFDEPDKYVIMSGCDDFDQKIVQPKTPEYRRLYEQ